MSDAAPAVRIGVYAVILAVVFAVAYVAGSVFVPDEVVHRWSGQVGGHAVGSLPAAPHLDAPDAHSVAH